MKSFLEGFDKLFPEIDNLRGLYTYVEDAEKEAIPVMPRAPQEYVRRVPTAISLDRENTAAFAEAVGLHADELGIILKEVFATDNTIVIDAFKKLISATKICTHVGDELTKHRDEERGRKEAAEEEKRHYEKMVRARKKAIKDKELRVADATTKHRKAWLAHIRAVETRYAAASGDLSKLAEHDRLLVQRAKRGTKRDDPFGFLRNQKGDKCVAVLSDVRSTLKHRMMERGLKKAIKGVDNLYQLESALDQLDKESANALFDTYVRRDAFVKGKEGYPGVDEWFVESCLGVGLGRKLQSAEGWQACLEMQHRNAEKLQRYDHHYGKGEKVRVFKDDRGTRFEIYK